MLFRSSFEDAFPGCRYGISFSALSFPSAVHKHSVGELATLPLRESVSENDSL